MDSDLLWSRYQFTKINAKTVVAPLKLPYESGIHWSLGKIMPYDRKIFKKIQKRRDVVWFVDDCKLLETNRKLIEDLQKHLKVDVFGNCNNLE